MKWTASKLRALKGEKKIAMLTAYDALTGSLVDEADVPAVLVGDSLGMTVLGYETTLPVSMEEMLHHTAAVSRGVENALVIADMPFMSYQPSIEMGLENAGRFIKEAGADAVKVEGGAVRSGLIEALVSNGIPVLGHIGLTPQSIKETGGYKVQGKTSEQARRLMDDAMAVEQAGAFALVLECVPAELGELISGALSIPTIGIGAGAGCDGQVLVFTDLLGVSGKHVPKFVKKYANLNPLITEALAAYKAEVESGAFPADEQTY
ncbi:3-methyl-2-oxobutanoate hydroxymethyltransferase [Pontiella sulfatireligans]|uniref:3-methyl-2-oxobutanoate hydroxymethyltransferase n=1 Tax=Pontiella sulfatireligans TaxID=2750658 RepID=A0A6C2UV94_9BACT|nr:3-methyl-2-oxobutanoate hydroxymethyltransferase [Pontiella sulfatireligans]VGO23094.1 3-methyl-2-oxobutanoate hydroxymethyltransferase [Pontiella sulfatireligans]